MSELEVTDLHVVYRATTAPFVRPRPVNAVRGVDLTVGAGEPVALVGASGAGKTTVAKAVARLVRARRGRIVAAGFDVTSFGRRAPREFRKAVQFVPQSAGTSLNPAWTVGEILAEPLRIHLQIRGHDASVRTAGLLDRVALPPTLSHRRAHELSAGQRQRVAIARALATGPRLIILDEPMSALDAVTGSQIVAVLEELRRESGIAYLLITHDIGLARHLCDRIAVMDGGRIVEEGPVNRVCDHPQHQFTRLLLASVLEPDPARQRAARARRRLLARQVGVPATR